MTNWLAPPEPVTWTIPASVKREDLTVGGLTYSTVTLSSPTGEQVLKAFAIPGASNADTTHRLIEAVSGEHVPYDVVKKLPYWMIDQMGVYMDSFLGSPSPDPLEAWRKARAAALSAEVSAAAGSAPPVS
jgi:hypothetical protein